MSSKVLILMKRYSGLIYNVYILVDKHHKSHQNKGFNKGLDYFVN